MILEPANQLQVQVVPFGQARLAGWLSSNKPSFAPLRSGSSSAEGADALLHEKPEFAWNTGRVLATAALKYLKNFYQVCARGQGHLCLIHDLCSVCRQSVNNADIRAPFLTEPKISLFPQAGELPEMDISPKQKSPYISRICSFIVPLL